MYDTLKSFFVGVFWTQAMESLPVAVLCLLSLLLLLLHYLLFERATRRVRTMDVDHFHARYSQKLFRFLGSDPSLEHWFLAADRLLWNSFRFVSVNCFRWEGVHLSRQDCERYSYDATLQFACERAVFRNIQTFME